MSLIIQTNLQNNCLQTNKHSTRFNHGVVIPVQIQASTTQPTAKDMAGREVVIPVQIQDSTTNTLGNTKHDNVVVIPVQIQASTTRHTISRDMITTLLSYPFKYRLLQPIFDRAELLKSVVIPVQIQTSTTLVSAIVFGAILSCNTRSNTGFYNRFDKIKINQKQKSCNTRSNTGFYNACASTKLSTTKSCHTRSNIGFYN